MCAIGNDGTNGTAIGLVATLIWKTETVDITGIFAVLSVHRNSIGSTCEIKIWSTDYITAFVAIDVCCQTDYFLGRLREHIAPIRPPDK